VVRILLLDKEQSLIDCMDVCRVVILKHSNENVVLPEQILIPGVAYLKLHLEHSDLSDELGASGADEA
jgi:hypothetical protein